MEIEPTTFNDEINVSSRSAGKQFLKLSISLAAVVFLLYLGAGLLLDLALGWISREQERYIFTWDDRQVIAVNDWVSERFEEQTPASMFLASLLAKIPRSVVPRDLKVDVELEDSELPNAFAYPGGHILFTSSLLQRLPSENSVLFILGHELGHIAERHNLKSFGRAITVDLLIGIFMGDVAGGSLFRGVSGALISSYSREQEMAADVWGLEVVNAVYSHAGGVGQTFEILQSLEDELMGYDPISATHPPSPTRFKALGKLARRSSIDLTGKLVPNPFYYAHAKQ